MMPPAVDQQEIAPAPHPSTLYESERAFWLVIVALTALYVAAVAVGNRRYVWFDELFTFDIARSASLHELWYRVLRFDCNPPPVYVLSRISMSIFGPTPFGLRFPSMIEFYLGSMVILLYVRRKASLAFAVVAVLMVWAVGPTLYYAVEARVYALLFFSFACLLLSWDTAIHAKTRGWALFGISISTLTMVGSHVFAPFTLFAFIVAEAVRFRRRRQPDYPLWAALLVPMLAMLLYIPLIRLYGGIIFSIQASYGKIIGFFEDTFGAPVMAFVLLAALLMPLRERPLSKRVRFSVEEIALFASLFLSPILLNLILMHRHGMFYNRYCLPSQVAILAALSIALANRVGLNRLTAFAAATVLTLAILRIQVWRPLRHPVPQGIGVLELVQPNLPIVVGAGTVFMEMNQRETPECLQECTS